MENENFNTLKACKNKTEAYKAFKITPNSKGILKLKEIAFDCGFDLDEYKERKKKLAKYCIFCGREIVSKQTRKKFCNSSCAASFNNKSRKINRKFNETIICPICGGKKDKVSLKCQNCENNYKKEKLLNRTLEDFIGNKKYLAHCCSTIRKNGRNILIASNTEKVCAYCKNHDYDEILEVHHIKGILKFDSSATIREINNIQNLIWLCPNHHAMLEKGLIKL